MPDDLSILDQLEDWLEAQVPPNLHNLHDLPFKMLETMERVTNEIFESLNIHGPPSISIPFPPFSGKEIPAPPPPPPPMSFQASLYHKADKYIRQHPYVAGALALTVGLGLSRVGRTLQLSHGWPPRLQKIRTRGVVKDGMLKEAVVLLSPSPMPPLLWPLAVTLLRAGYIVLIAVPHTEDAEQLERCLTLEEKSALRVLIYDPEESTTFPPFHRSLGATLTLRFLAPGNLGSGDPYKPEPEQLPRIHAFISLYALNPCPPTQPGALPALPTLLAPDGQKRQPKLITLYPSGSMIVTPDSFASQLLTVNHLLLQRNLIASARGSFASIFIGHLQLPQLTQMLLNDRSRVNHSMFEVHTQPASQTGKLLSFKDQLLNVIGTGWSTITAVFGLGKGAQDYAHFERCILKALKSSKRTVYTVGQYSTLALCVRSIHPRHMERALAYLPTMPGATGPLSITAHGLSEPHHSLIPVRSTTNSSSESDHDGGEDLASSRHTVTSDEDGSGGSVTGLDASWVGVESGN